MNRRQMIQNANIRRDPTGTTTIRRDYARELRARLDGLIWWVNRVMVDNDALRIDNVREAFRPEIIELFEGNEAVRLQSMTTAFEKNIDEFYLGIERQADGTILKVNPYYNEPTRRAYEKGIRDADFLLRHQGMNISTAETRATLRGIRRANEFQQMVQPVVQELNERLVILQERNFQELKNVGQATATEIQRVLQEGVIRGINSLEIARDMNERIRRVGKHRSTLIARTEIIRAHNEAALNRYEQHGITEVEGRAEILTAGDNRVCDLCAGIEGSIYKIAEARGIIPIHPQCRCAWIPVVPSAQTVQAISGPGGLGQHAQPRVQSNSQKSMNYLRMAQAKNREHFPRWYVKP